LFCARKDALFERYNLAVLDHAIASTQLANVAGTSTHREYERLRKRVQQFRLDLEEARRVFENHVVEHGCGSPA